MVFAAAFIGITQLLRVIYLLRLGAGLELIGLLYGIGALLFGVLGLPSGALGERIGPRRAMLLGAGVLTLGLCLLPITELLTGPVRAVWPIVAELVNTLGWSLLVVNRGCKVVGRAGRQFGADPRGDDRARGSQDGLRAARGADGLRQPIRDVAGRPAAGVFRITSGHYNRHARALSIRPPGERRPGFRRAALAHADRVAAL